MPSPAAILGLSKTSSPKPSRSWGRSNSNPTCPAKPKIERGYNHDNEINCASESWKKEICETAGDMASEVHPDIPRPDAKHQNISRIRLVCH
jgi:hypothetical protein